MLHPLDFCAIDGLNNTIEIDEKKTIHIIQTEWYGTSKHCYAESDVRTNIQNVNNLNHCLISSFSK